MPNPRIEAVSRLVYRTGAHAGKSDPMVARQRAAKVTVTTSAANFTPKHTAKSGQNWRYAGGRVVRAATKNLDPLSNKEYTDPKDPSMPRRKQESNFFITINSNKNMDNLELEKGTKQMTQMLEKLSTAEAMAAYFKFGPVDPVYQNDRFAAVVKLPVCWKAAVETGDVMNRLHCHIWMTVEHYSQIQMNVQMLQAVARDSFNQGLGAKDELRIGAKPYVHVKLLPQSDWTTVMKQYIHKGMIDCKSQSED
jgi:hypothetical protein